MYRRSVRGLAGACLLLAGSLSTGALAAGDDALPAARQELRLRVATERRMREEFESLIANRGMSGAEISDFEHYLAGLARVVAEQRAKVAKLDGRESDSSAGSGDSDSQDAFLSADFNRGQTDAEKIAILDAELGSSLSDFDEKLLREQREIAEKSRSASTSASGGQAGGGGETGKAGEGEGQGRGKAATSDSAQSATESAPQDSDSAGQSGQESVGGKSQEADGKSDEQVASAGGSGRKPAKNPPPPDIADGKDDDIVARQLREAAENEQDPELRDKLWEEYRNYKNSTR